MRKKFTLLIAACALLTLFILPATGWGQTKDATQLLSEDFSTLTKGDNTSNNNQSTQWSGNSNFTSTTKAYEAGGAVKLGASSATGSITSKLLNVSAGSTLTVAFKVKGWTTVEGNIKVTAGSQNSTVSYSQTMSGNFESKSVDFTIPTGVTSLTVKLETTAKRAFLDDVVVTLTTSGGGTTTPSITASNVNIAYDAVSGSLAYEINNPVNGGAVTAATVTASNPSGWLTVNGSNPFSSPISLSCEANASTTTEKTATVQLTYTYNTNQTVTKDVTVTQGKAPMTIAAVRSQGTGSVLTKGIITYIDSNKKNAYIQDATAAIDVFKNSSNYFQDYAVGDEILVSGSLTTYSGGGNLLEIDPSTITKLSSDNDLPYVEKTVAEINTDNFSNLQSLRVKIVNATVQSVSGSNNTIAQTIGGVTSTILVYSSSMGVQANDVITSFYANVGYYSGLQLINPTDVQVQHDPTITTDATNNSLAVPNQIFGSYDATGYATLKVNGTSLTANISLSLGASSNFEMSTDLDTWTNFLTLTQTNGSVTNAEVAVRLKDNLAKGSYQGSITLSSDDATNVTVSLSGQVTGQTYTIEQYTSPATAHGTITFAPTSPVEDGTEVTLTAEPAEGYDFTANSWVFYKESGQDYVADNSITVTNGKIMMPAYNLWVDATFSQVNYSIAIASGYTHGTVEVENNITTAHFNDNITVNVTPEDGYQVKTFTVTETSGEGSVSSNDIAVNNGAYSFSMPAFNVTITVEFEEIPNVYGGTGTFNQITSTNDLEDGGYYVLYGVNGDYKGAMNSTCSSNKMGVTTNVTFESDAIKDPAKSIVWKLEKIVVSNETYWYLYNEEAGKYCYIYRDKADGFAMGNDEDEENGYANNYYSVSVGDEDEFYFTGQYNSRNISIYQSDFRCYGSSNYKSLYLYKLGEASQDPYFTAEGVEIDYDDENGEIAYTVNNPVDGGTVSAEVTDGDWLELGQGTASPISFTCSANTEYSSREATVTLTYTYGNSKATVTKGVVITQGAAPYPTTTYTLATAIESGRHYIIVGMDGENAYAMGKDKGNNRNAIGNGVAVSTDAVTNITTATVSSADVVEFVVNGPDALGYYTIYDANWKTANGGYLYAAHSSQNYLKTRQFNEDGNSQWSIVFDGDATITAQGDNTRKLMRFNPNNGSPLFACYAVSNNPTGQPVSLYVKNEDTPQYDFYKDIAKYTVATTSGEDKANGWYLIATPVVAGSTPSDCGLITDDNTDLENLTYDFYAWDDNETDEWRNYRQSNFNMFNGQGYLYANKDNVTLHFTGTPRSSSEDVSVTSNEAGWVLYGNPFPCKAYLNDANTNLNFYRMNADGDGFIAATGAINPLEGVFVKATAVDQRFNFSRTQNSTSKTINVQVSKAEKNAKVSDRAIIRFDESSMLEKFMLNEDGTKIYVTLGSKDYAVVRSNGQGETPVSFKAAENGTYTISVEAENLDVEYLHLIDNKAGKDVDLLATPSYSFEAKTSDYASRFRLVFSVNTNTAENGNETFAYYNGSEWVISNMGEATLQVVDVMGRVLSSETVSGNANVSLNQTPGVYVIRLVNGDSVKTQKIVVR